MPTNRREIAIRYDQAQLDKLAELLPLLRAARPDRAWTRAAAVREVVDLGLAALEAKLKREPAAA